MMTHPSHPLALVQAASLAGERHGQPFPGPRDCRPMICQLRRMAGSFAETVPATIRTPCARQRTPQPLSGLAPWALLESRSLGLLPNPIFGIKLASLEPAQKVTESRSEWAVRRLESRSLSQCDVGRRNPHRISEGLLSQRNFNHRFPGCPPSPALKKEVAASWKEAPVDEAFCFIIFRSFGERTSFRSIMPLLSMVFLYSGNFRTSEFIAVKTIQGNP